MNEPHPLADALERMVLRFMETEAGKDPKEIERRMRETISIIAEELPPDRAYRLITSFMALWGKAEKHRLNHGEKHGVFGVPKRAWHPGAALKRGTSSNASSISDGRRLHWTGSAQSAILLAFQR